MSGFERSIQKVISSNCSVSYSCDYLRNKGIFINHNPDFIFAYILAPVHSFMLHITKNRETASLLSILSVFAILGLFVFYLIDVLYIEISNLARSPDAVYSFFSDLLMNLTGLTEKYAPGISLDITDQISRILVSPAGWAFTRAEIMAAPIASQIPLYIAGFFVSVLLTYYFLKDGKKIIDQYLELLPEREVIKMFLEELDAIYYGLFNVYLINCALTGIIATVLFFLIGIPFPVLLGGLVAFAALIPMVGSSVVYIPLALYYLVIHDYAMAVTLFVSGAVLLNIIPENFIRPGLAHYKGSIHPIITLLSFTAPIFVIGVMGVIIGPALYGFLLAVYRVMMKLLKGDEEADG
ncbi:AI-2E family transporter [uncultured archaeon]|nr:AI-2E family transporter [uncultured archaeon]